MIISSLMLYTIGRGKGRGGMGGGRLDGRSAINQKHFFLLYKRCLELNKLLHRLVSDPVEIDRIWIRPIKMKATFFLFEYLLKIS